MPRRADDAAHASVHVPILRDAAVTLPLAVGVVATGIAAAGSWIPSLWGDEAATILSATRTLPSLWTQTQHLDAVHATYYLLMHVWIHLFGASAFSVRFPSAVAVGAGAAGLVVLLRLWGRGRGSQLLVAAVYVTLPRVAYIGQEARSFAWGGALATWTLVIVVAVLQGRLRRRTGWPLYALVVAAATWLLLFNAAVIAVVGVALAASRRTRTHLRAWALASAAAVVAASPVILLGYAQRGQVGYLEDTAVTPSAVFVSTWFGNPFFAVVAWALILVGLAGVVHAARPAASLAPAVLVASPETSRRDTWMPGLLADVGPGGLDRRVLIVAWAFLPIAVLLVTDPVVHLFAERYVAASTPAVAILIVEGVQAAWHGWGDGRRATSVRRRPTPADPQGAPGRHQGAPGPRRAPRGGDIRWPGVVAALCLTVAAVAAGVAQRTPYAESGSDWAAVASYLHERATPGSDILFAETVTASRRARNALRLYPQDFAGLHDVALTVPWFDQSTTWYDRAMTVGQAARAGRVTSPTVWVVETDGSHDEGFAALRDAGYRVVSSRRFSVDTVYALARESLS